MGYTTDFKGEFKFNQVVSHKVLNFLKKLNETRRMKRNIEGFGVEGEFYVNGTGSYGQTHEDNIIAYNEAPSTQPGLWCKWCPNEDGTAIEHDGAEKFYDYIEWIVYIIEKILKPNGYSITGIVKWRGEDFDDTGTISILNNEVSVNGELITPESCKKSTYTSGKFLPEENYMQVDIVWLEKNKLQVEPVNNIDDIIEKHRTGKRLRKGEIDELIKALSVHRNLLPSLNDITFQ